VTRKTVQTLVEKQFGPRAAAYVASPVHAQGEDLNELAALAEAHKFGRALDLGCGGGHVGFTLAPHVGEIVAYDLSEAMLAAVVEEAKKRGISNLTALQGAVEMLPFADASFDFVATRYSAHHWHDVPRALGEARRVLKPGGCALFMDVVAPEAPLLDTFLQTVELLRDPSHVRDYSVREWTAMLRAAGFAPAEPVRRRLHIDYASWTQRMQTPKLQADAVLALMAQMPAEVGSYFAFKADGSFTFDTMSLLAGS
jgi:SAM-dependent methyltransferase